MKHIAHMATSGVTGAPAMTMAASVSPPAGIGSPWNGPAGTWVTLKRARRSTPQSAKNEAESGPHIPASGPM